MHFIEYQIKISQTYYFVARRHCRCNCANTHIQMSTVFRELAQVNKLRLTPLPITHSSLYLRGHIGCESVIYKLI